jgi:hypothetical protein
MALKNQSSYTWSPLFLSICLVSFSLFLPSESYCASFWTVKLWIVTIWYLAVTYEVTMLSFGR